MQNIISEFYSDKEMKVITPNDAHYFFAYYDMRATGEKGNHLTHRVQFIDRLPTADDVAEIGYLKDGKFHMVDYSLDAYQDRPVILLE